MRIKKLSSMLLVGLLCFGLCGCNAHEDVESQIAALGEITLDSKDELDAIASAYKELSESQQKKVANYSDYKIALEEYDAIVYENLDTIYYEIAFTDYANHAEILIGLSKYEKYFKEGQKTGLLANYYFYEDAPQYAEKYIVSRLKSPRSYYCYSLDAKCFVVGTDEDNEHRGTVDITYGATNSFGGEVTDELHFSLRFKLNSDKKGITVTSSFIS